MIISLTNEYETECYNLDNFANLPTGLEYIEINKKIFNSVNELVENYDCVMFENLVPFVKSCELFIKTIRNKFYGDK